MQKIKQKLLKNLTPILKNQIKTRLQEFQELKNSNNQKWFNELCFCLLTANSKAETAMKIQIAMNPDGFEKKTQTEIANIIRKHGHRFHNTKSSYIFSARKFNTIKETLQKMSSFNAREFLVSNVKGLGYKEASHFLRNVGRSDVAIIDRHVLRFLKNENLISEIPKTISRKNYLEYEKILNNFNIPQDELDLIIWANMTNKVLK